MTEDVPNLVILHLSADDCGEESFYRVLVNGTTFKYISIEAGIYSIDDLCFPPALLPKLPPLPLGHWNLAHIAKSPGTSSPQFSWAIWRAFRGIEHIWHQTQIDYLSLDLGRMLMANVYGATSPHFKEQIIAKFARFPWETAYYEAETQACAWIEGHNIGPRFLGHVKEEERPIGFLLEKVEGRHATPDDLEACRTAVSRLHALGIVHGDLNKHNFLISGCRVVLLDFESARRSEDKEEMNQELCKLEQELFDESGRGSMFTVPPEVDIELSKLI